MESETGTATEGLFSLMSLLSILRAQRWVYQSCHWQTRGDVFYGNHLLFQRLYESVDSQIDSLAEKIVGIFGVEYVDPIPSMDKTRHWIQKWCSEEANFHQRGMNSEQDLLRVARETYEIMKRENTLTLGLDDFIMAMSSDHETNVYLLKQVLRNGGA